MVAIDYAVVAAAGGLGQHGFEKPVALLPLNGETVISRLLRQLDGIETFVGVGKVGRRGWTSEHLAEFEKLSCRTIQSSFWKDREGVRTTLNLLEFLTANYPIEDTSRIYAFYGDFVFTDELLREVLTYPAPVAWAYKWGSPGAIFTGEILPLVLSTPHISSNMPRFIGTDCISFIPKLINRPREFTWDSTGNFMEIDTPKDYLEAIELVGRGHSGS